MRERSRNTYSSAMHGRTCERIGGGKGMGAKYRLDGVEYRCFEFFLVDVFRKSLSDLMRELYVENEMSLPDIRNLFTGLFGFCVSEKTLSRYLDTSGVPARSYAERKRLSWKQGKMDGALPKMRQSCKRTYMIGSKAERTVRYLLREGLLVLDVKWDVVIGDNLQHILDRFEVDIPLVIIEREAGRACRIAIEVDSSFTHSSPERQERDERKDEALKAAGWHVLRISTDGFQRQGVTSERVTDLVLRVEQIAEDAFRAACDWEYQNA